MSLSWRNLICVCSRRTNAAERRAKSLRRRRRVVVLPFECHACDRPCEDVQLIKLWIYFHRRRGWQCPDDDRTIWQVDELLLLGDVTYMQWSQQSGDDQLRRRLIQRATTHARVTICRRSSSSDFNRPNWPNRRSCENATELWWEENIDHQAARCVSSLVLDELYDHRGTSVFLLVQVCFTIEIPMYVHSFDELKLFARVWNGWF